MNVVTISAIKADVGGYVGHSAVHPDLVVNALDRIDAAIGDGLLIDGGVNTCGDDVNLLMTHRYGVDAEPIHRFAWDTFVELADAAKRLHLHGAGQDLLADTFLGNIRAVGPRAAEMDIFERPSEPFIVFAADKTAPGVWNLPLYRIFCDPFNTAGLTIDKTMRAGFTLEVHDLIEHRRAFFSCPEDLYDLLLYTGTTSRFVIKHVFRRGDNGDPVASTSTSPRLRPAGSDTGEDDPIMIVRCQGGLPAVGEVLEPFATPHYVSGGLSGAHHGPLMPRAIDDTHSARFDGPSRVIGMGFQLADGRLVGPRDLLGDVSFDPARRQALEMAEYMRRMGPFEPARLAMDTVDDRSISDLAERMHGRWEPVEDPVAASV